MDMIAIFHRHPQLAAFNSSIVVKAITTEEDYKKFELDRDEFLARDGFLDCIPRGTHVELLVRRAEEEGPGPNGNDYVFINAWGPSRPREVALRTVN